MKQGTYPTADAIAQTVRHQNTSLSGARSFYASTGVVAYADERLGLANIASRTTLGPNAARRLSTFLDMVTPGVGGLIMQPAGVQALQLGVAPSTACARLREAAETKQQVPVGSRSATLCFADSSTDDNWEWMGVLSYDHKFRLKTGQFTTGRLHVTFHVRSGGHPTQSQILVEIRHADDLDIVHNWMSSLLPTSERWSITPFALLSDRHDEVRSVVAAIGGDGALVASPQIQRHTRKRADAEVTEFTRNMRDARYTTSSQGLDSLIERAESVDDAVLVAFDLFAWTGEGNSRVAVKVRLKQLGTDPLTITWGAARELRTAAGVRLPQSTGLDAVGWEQMSPAGWNDDQRMTHLRAIWHSVVRSVGSDAASCAA